jgi:MFS family permease
METEQNSNYMLPVIGSFLGWLMDGYVTISYLIQESTIQPLFFPGDLYIVYFFLFVVNGIARAIGAAFLGNFIGDRLGRKRMMVVTILIFSLSSFSLGFLPTYAQIGPAAPVIMGVLLFMMGLFAGAEYGGGTALSMESVPMEKRNLMGAFVQSGFGVGYAILGFVYFIISSVTGPAYVTIGWRILFITTIIPGLSAFGIRFFMPESKVFETAKKKKEIYRSPLLKLVKDSWKVILVLLAITGGLLFIDTATFSLYPTIFQEVDGFTRPTTGFWVAIINLISIAGVILGGTFARFSNKRLIHMFRYSVIFLIATIIIDMFAFSHSLLDVVVAFSVQAFFEAMIFSSLPAFMSESFSKLYRTTGVGFVYNLGSTLGSLAILVIPTFSLIYGWKLFWLFSVVGATLIMLLGMSISARMVAESDKRVDAITQ